MKFSCAIYHNSIPDQKFFIWFEKSKLTSHLSHILQMANQLRQLLISHRQDTLYFGVWVGGHTQKTAHPQAMEFFGVQKYFLWIEQHNMFEKHKRSGHPKEITVTLPVVIQT